MTYNVFSGTLNPTHSLTFTSNYCPKKHREWTDCSTTKVVRKNHKFYSV